MADENEKLMHMVSEPNYAADGMTVLYGPGELHEPGALPDGVAFRAVVVGPAQIETAPVHAKDAPSPQEQVGEPLGAPAAPQSTAASDAHPAAAKTETAAPAAAEAAPAKTAPGSGSRK